MGAMSERALGLDDDRDVGNLAAIAAALGGEVHGRAVRAPSPGRPADDRSCVIIINPGRPQSFWIYACEGPLGRAKDRVREKLKLIAPQVASLAQRSAAALRIWEDGVPAAGTIVEQYLRSRCITLPPPARLRFHPRLRHGPTDETWPAMVALVTNIDDAPIAIHRTYLRYDGRGKAPIEPDKMTLGPTRGSAIRLALLADQLLIGEGIETCLSAMQATGMPAWSALSAVGLRALALPPSVSDIIVLADGDDNGEAAARAAAARWIGEGRRVRIARPPAGKDFNDVLIEESGT
jgi:putative DNA primase/helicase